MNLKTLETPCLILDKEKMQANISGLQRHLRQLNVNLRPHGKTAKNINVLEVALRGQAGGITVSTLKEAEYYFDHGIVDIVYAVGIVPRKLERIAALFRKGAQVTVILDSIEQVRMVAAKAVDYQLQIPVLIEVDCDGHRSGVKPDDDRLIDIGRLIHEEKGLSWAGILTHAGESYSCRSVDEIRSLAASERDIAVKCAGRLRRNGLPCPIVSIGSTPTAVFAADLSGITEVRAGVFMFYDLVMAGLGVCAIDDIAISVLATVIGHQKEKGWLITDAGWMALSRDRGTATQRVDRGYGLVCDVDGKLISGLQVTAANQEHGIISGMAGKDINWKKFAIGSMLRILPNHACATAAMFGCYKVVENATDIVATWSRVNGW